MMIGGKRFIKKKPSIKFIIGAVIFATCLIIALLYFMSESSLGKGSNDFILEKEVIEDVYNEPFVVIMSNEETSIDEIEDISEEELKILQVDKDKIKNDKNLPTYYIKINYGANVVNIYKKDENNEYTIPVKSMICSTGTATPKSGVYKMNGKYRWLALFGNVYGQYCSRIVGHILFHSVPYLENGNNGSIEYWEYDKLGQSASAGCIRLTVADAMWIYNNCPNGTMVEFYSSDDPGPFGKPTARKISSAPENIRGWDPTDPDANNPWKIYNNSTDMGNQTPDVGTEIVDNITDNNVVDNNIEPPIDDSGKNEVIGEPEEEEEDDNSVNELVNELGNGDE